MDQLRDFTCASEMHTSVVSVCEIHSHIDCNLVSKKYA
jgi:hypothetical protein